jgi:hypothetical protein
METFGGNVTRIRRDMMETRLKLLGILLLSALFMMPAFAYAGKEPGTLTPEGKGYIYYYHDFSDPEAFEGAGQENEFDISRLYFGAKYQISEEFMARYLTDISHASGGGKFEVFTKYAYVDWALAEWNAHLLMGLQGTNNWSMPEKAWGYRSIRKSPMESFGGYWGDMRSYYEASLDAWALADPSKATELMAQKDNFHTGANTKTGSSADLGIGLKWKHAEHGYVNVMVRNGPGYKKAENDIYKNFQARAGTYLLEKAVHLSAYVELEPWKGVDDSGDPESYSNLQWDVMGSYQQKDLFLVGANVNSKTIPGNFEDITATCMSGFGNVHLIPNELKALARYDVYTTGFNDAKRPSGADAPETDATLLIVGLDYMPAKNVHFIPNVQILSFEHDDIKSENHFFIHLEFKF